jgi:hypothetical protein
MTTLATSILLLLIAACIAGIEAEQPARLVSRKQSRAKRDLRDALWAMRRTK